MTETHTTALDSAELTYTERGEGRPFLILHGGAARSRLVGSPTCSPNAKPRG